MSFERGIKYIFWIVFKALFLVQRLISKKAMLSNKPGLQGPKNYEQRTVGLQKS